VPFRVTLLPNLVRRREVDDSAVAAGHVLLGVGGDSSAPVGIDVFAGDARWLIAGPPRSGRSTALAAILTQARAYGWPTLIAAPQRSPLVGAGEAQGVDVVRPDGPFPELAAGQPRLILVDDSEAFADSVNGVRLEELAQRAGDGRTAVVVSGRADDVAMVYRGLVATVRRSQSGLLLRPAPGDGDLLGVKLARVRTNWPPGRGVLVAHQPHLRAQFGDEPALAVQVALG
jgi:S-DNA-T family DNA segregation ATPase FtsK/SpoIIIE